MLSSRRSPSPRSHTCERRALLQVLYQSFDVVQVPAQLVLLLLLRADALVARASFIAVGGAAPPLEHAGQLARTPGARGLHGSFRHEVEVQELQELDLDLLRCLLIFEQRRHRQQAVHLLEDACVLGCRQQRGDEHEESRGLDCWAIEGIEKVEKQVHLVFASEDGARGRVQEQQPLHVGEGREDEEVVLAIWSLLVCVRWTRRSEVPLLLVKPSSRSRQSATRNATATWVSCCLSLRGTVLAIPLKAFLQPEELAKRWVFGQLSQLLWRGLWLLAKIDGRLIPSVAGLGWCGLSARQADLGEHALDLAQPLPDLLRVLGRDVVKGEGEQRLHRGLRETGRRSGGSVQRRRAGEHNGGRWRWERQVERRRQRIWDGEA